jgi:hypothetical protein
MDSTTPNYTAFSDHRIISQGPLDIVSQVAIDELRNNPKAYVLVFDDLTGQVVDLDLRNRSQQTSRGPGRPKLGVMAREVTLLPRHWDWLATQTGGASVALRRLVEEARRTKAVTNRVRAAQEATYKFLSALVGNEPGFEEALRALYRGDRKRFTALVNSWSGDVSSHALKLADAAFSAPNAAYADPIKIPTIKTSTPPTMT